MSLEPMHERRTFEQLFAAHARAVYAYARRRVADGEADDVVAETFTVAWRRLDQLPERPLPYLLAIARKVIGNRRRSSRRRGALLERLGTEVTTASTAVEGEGLRAEEALRVLARVPEREREALLLIAWEGLSPEDAATVLGCTRNAVDLRIFRARRRIEAFLAATEKDDGRGGHHTTEEVHR